MSRLICFISLLAIADVFYVLKEWTKKWLQILRWNVNCNRKNNEKTSKEKKRDPKRKKKLTIKQKVWDNFTNNSCKEIVKLDMSTRH